MPEEQPREGNGEPRPKDPPHLYERIRLLAQRVALKRLSAADAADLAQELLLELLMRPGQSLGEEHLDGELGSIVGSAVRYKIIDLYRAQKRWDGHADEHETSRLQAAQDARNPEAVVELKELIEIIGRALHAMSPERRETFLRVKMDGLSHQEVAKERGITDEAVVKNVMRTTHVLREALIDYRPGMTR